MTRSKGNPAFSEAVLRAKKAYNAQAHREGRPAVSEHDMEEAAWAVFELLRDRKLKANGSSETPMIRSTYSPTADALSVRLARGIGHVGTRELKPDIYADFDEKGRLVGIEVLNAGGFYDQAELEQLPRPGDGTEETEL